MDEPQSQKSGWTQKVLIAIGVVFAFVFFSALLEQGPLKTGTVAPDYRIPLANGGGGTLESQSFGGKVTVLDFWSTTCPPCVAQIPVLQELRRDYAARGVEVVGIAVGGETLPRIAKFAAQRQIAYPMGPDLQGVAATAYKVSTLPTLFIVGKDGKIAKSHIGYWDAAGLRAALDEVLEN